MPPYCTEWGIKPVHISRKCLHWATGGAHISSSNESRSNLSRVNLEWCDLGVIKVLSIISVLKFMSNDMEIDLRLTSNRSTRSRDATRIFKSLVYLRTQNYDARRNCG